MIIKIRNKQGISQEQLAETVGVSRSRIAQIEAGVKLHKTSFDIFLRVLQGLGYSYKITALKSVDRKNCGKSIAISVR